MTTATSEVPESPGTDGDFVARSNFEWTTLVVAFVVYLVSPYFVGNALGASTATTVMLLVITFGSVLLGLVDGLIFKPSSGFALGCAIMQYIAGWIYYNEGAWLYTLAVITLVSIGGLLSKLFTRGRNRTEKATTDGGTDLTAEVEV